jgi:glycosyltransferase involved in cell wall biosynthesis
MGREADLMSYTVITPTIPQRRLVLLDALASVEAQSLPPVEHLIAVDSGYPRNALGPSVLRQQMLCSAVTTWVAFLDDDDTLDAHHAETMLMAIAENPNADLVYTWCRFDGPPLPEIYYNNHYDREALRERGIFPVTVFARREAMLDSGGFSHADTYEDWSLWNRMADAGANFVCVPEITWTYRTGHESRTTQAMEGLR